MSPFLKSPMPGTVVSVAVSVGDTVRHNFDLAASCLSEPFDK